MHGIDGTFLIFRKTVESMMPMFIKKMSIILLPVFDVRPWEVCRMAAGIGKKRAKKREQKEEGCCSC